MIAISGSVSGGNGDVKLGSVARIARLLDDSPEEAGAVFSMMRQVSRGSDEVVLSRKDAVLVWNVLDRIAERAERS